MPKYVITSQYWSFSRIWEEKRKTFKAKDDKEAKAEVESFRSNVLKYRHINIPALRLYRLEKEKMIFVSGESVVAIYRPNR